MSKAVRLRAVIYARVSGKEQKERHTIENQLPVLTRFIEHQGWDLVETYIDDGRSAKTGMLEGRKDFARLQKDAHARLMDVVAVVNIDRLTRTEDLQERARILGPFQQLGIKIATPSSGIIDLSTMLGELYTTMQAIFAAEDQRKRVAACTAGHSRAISEGRLPQGKAPFGLTYSRKVLWGLDSERSAVVREIFERLAAGEKCSTIADDFHARGLPYPRRPWTKIAVWKIARSSYPMGAWEVRHRLKQTIPVPPIVDEGLWYAAQTAMAKGKARGRIGTKHDYLLSGLMRCGACAAPVFVKTAQRETSGYVVPGLYICRHRVHIPPRGVSRCMAPSARIKELDERVWEAVTQEIAQPGLAAQIKARAEALAATPRDWETEAETQRANLARLAKVEASLLAWFRTGKVSEAAFGDEIEAIRRDRAEANKLLAAAGRASREHGKVAPTDAVDWLQRVRGLMKGATPTDRNAIMRILVAPRSAILDGDKLRLSLQIAKPVRSDLENPFCFSGRTRCRG